MVKYEICYAEPIIGAFRWKIIEADSEDKAIEELMQNTKVGGIISCDIAK